MRSAQWNGPFGPLNLAAYLTWAAVAFGPALDWYHGSLADSWDTRLGMIGLVAVPVLYVLRCLDPGEPLSIAENQARRLVLAQVVAAVLACWGLVECCGLANNRAGVPVLLVIVAAQIAVLFPVRATVLLILAMNLPLVIVLVQRWSPADAIPGIICFGGFQAFAAFTMGYAKRTEHAREAALRINAELLATRQLLGEGARAEERLRLSRELHDVAGHKLTALKMQLALQARQAPSAAAIAECERLADEVLADIRSVVGTLRQHEGVDLQQALRALDPRLPRPTVRFELDPAVRVADMPRAEALLRSAQEGLTNALRHSGAAQVRVCLQRGRDGIELGVEDDGRGRAAQIAPGNGLRGLRERLSEVGGRLELRDAAPSGLVLRAVLPEGPAPGADIETRLHALFCPWQR